MSTIHEETFPAKSGWNTLGRVVASRDADGRIGLFVGSDGSYEDGSLSLDDLTKEQALEILDKLLLAVVRTQRHVAEWPETTAKTCPKCGILRGAKDWGEHRVDGVWTGEGCVDCMEVCATCYWSWRMRAPESPLSEAEKGKLTRAWLVRNGALRPLYGGDGDR